MAPQSRVLLGTTKGAFFLEQAQTGWAVSGPHCNGAGINHAIGDTDSGMIWAAGGNDWTGRGIWRTGDGGRTWDLSADDFAEGSEVPVEALWSLAWHDGKLFAGTKPAELFVSQDAGVTWSHMPGLTRHPSRDDWFPGNAGLILHTILGARDEPERLWVGISAVGVFASEDGGVTWEPRNRGTRNDYAPDPYPEVGICVHNIVPADGRGDMLYQQGHCGTYRSADAGRNWTCIEDGLPSTFGFPIAVHPQDPQTIWVFPLNGDSQGRYPPDAVARVWRSRDGGDNWTPVGNGLPDKDCFFTVLRQAMAIEGGPLPRLFFGTNSGSVYASDDEGDSWTEIARHLPTILSVEVMAL